MRIAIYRVMSTRPCRFCLSLQDGSVFADFDVDADGSVFVRRISYDGYGCCDSPDVGRLSDEASGALLSMVERGAIESDVAEPWLRTYFRANAIALWDDALAHHGLT